MQSDATTCKLFERVYVSCSSEVAHKNSQTCANHPFDSGSSSYTQSPTSTPLYSTPSSCGPPNSLLLAEYSLPIVRLPTWSCDLKRNHRSFALSNSQKHMVSHAILLPTSAPNSYPEIRLRIQGRRVLNTKVLGNPYRPSPLPRRRGGHLAHRSLQPMHGHFILLCKGQTGSISSVSKPC
jgi:hypothetical protein